MAPKPPTRVTLPVTGMTCANCAGIIERGLNKLDGVESAAVNLADESVAVEYRDREVSLGALIARLEKLGYSVPTEDADLPITGMTCANCAANIQRALGRMPGVVEAAATFAGERAQVVFVPRMVSVPDLVERVRSLGFDVVDRSGDGPIDAEQQARDRETARQLRLTVLGLALTVPVFVLGMGGMFGLFPMESWMIWVMAALATPVQFVVGWDYYVGAWKSLANRSANMDVLVAMGSSAAYFYSAALLLIHVLSPHSGHMDAGMDMGYFETSAMIITLIKLGKYLEARAKGRTGAAIRALMDLSPKKALVERDGVELEVPAAEVRLGDLVVVKPGGSVPVDGEIVEGRSAVDESMLTGESVPADKSPGDKVSGGTVNTVGRIKFRAEAVGGDTALARIIELVRRAQGSRAPIQSLADRVSAVFVPVIVLTAALTFAGWLLLGGSGAVALVNAVSVLVIACPCALGLATPTALMVGMGRGAGMGILIKSGESLERAGAVTAVILDKTGTLTRGEPALTDIELVNPEMDPDRALALAAAVEAASEHPVAGAVRAGALERGLRLEPVDEFEAVAGRGVRGVVGGRRVLVGTRSFLAENGVDVRALAPAAGELESRGRTVLALAVDGEPTALLAVADTVRPEARRAVDDFKRLGIQVAMLTGDNERTARAVAGELGIERVLAQVLPEDKAAEVGRLQAEGGVVAMVGDGINDAPALAAADVGMALGAGTDAAMEAGAVALMGGDVNLAPAAVRLSRATMSTIKANLFWAFFYNTMLVPLAAFGFIHPIFAAGAMSLSSVFVVGNSLRLRTKKL